MSEGAKSQASVSRSRPAGSRRNQQPACTSEDSGVRYSTRSRSNVAPTPPRSAENQRSRKASNMEKPASSAQDGGPSGGKLSAHGGKAELAEESWGLQKPKESVSTYASRVMSHLREYEEASKTIRRLREELRCTSAKAAGASRPRKTQLQAEVKQIKLDINELEVRKAFLREKSGPFKEKLINEDRFREMADNREQRQMGLQPESQVDDDDDDQQKAPPGSLQSHPQATCSELPAGQATLASGRSSAGSGEDSDSSGQGGALMAEIKLLESPVCLQNFHLGDDLPEEAPGDQKKKVKNKPKLQEARQLPQQQVLLQEARLRKEKTVALLDRQVAEVKDTVSRFKSSVRDQLNSMRSYLDIMENSLFREADKAEINASGALLGERKSLAHYVEQLGQMEGVLKDVEGQEQTEFLRKFCVVTARLGKILSESPLPGRLDIQLPIISDEFKFQVWRKMFRALMPGLENLTFDPDSAQQNLVVSGDGKSVECSDHKQPVSDDPGRFDKGNCLVTKQSFTEGEHYWEVVVEDKPRWALGVISETANRKGKLHASPSNGFWIMGCKEGKVYEAHAEAKEPRLLRVDGRPEKIGVYLSFSDGVVSFFDSGDEDNVKLLYTFHERFSGRLHPFFDVCWHDKGKNSQPLKFYVPPGGQ